MAEAAQLASSCEIFQGLAREIDVLELKGRIESRAEKEMTDAQRQYVLRQQMKAIQSELGEGDTDAVDLTSVDALN